MRSQPARLIRASPNALTLRASRPCRGFRFQFSAFRILPSTFYLLLFTFYFPVLPLELPGNVDPGGTRPPNH